MKDLFIKIFCSIIFICITVYLIITDRNKTKIIIQTLNKKRIIFNLILILIFYIFINYIINNDKINMINISKDNHKGLITATNKALFGFIIAFFSHMDLFIAPFWFIFFALTVFKLDT